MKLYLVRHGESLAAGSDDERPLSEKGKKDIQSLANFIAARKLQVSYVYQSPKFRAKQTAEILSSQILSAHGIETRIELDPMSATSEILDEITLLNEDIMLVGHMPFMGKMVARLISGNENQDVVSFNPGSMVCLEKVGNETWLMRWMLTPELFEA